jgi:hypothetical protein
MFLTITNAVLLGLGIKLCIYAITIVSNYSGLTSTLRKMLIGNAGAQNGIGGHLGLTIILLSILISLIYSWRSKKELQRTEERRFSLRLWLFIVIAGLLSSLAQSMDPSREFPFLWCDNVLKPDPVVTLYGVGLNLWAITSMSLYLIYASILSLKRKSIDATFHITCAITIFLLTYQLPAALFIFWSVQSVSLIILSRKLAKISSPCQ